MKKLLRPVLAIALALSLAIPISIVPALGVSGQAAAQEECTLQKSMAYLVDECGVRRYGTPNERKLAQYVTDQFAKYLGEKNAELVKLPILNLHGNRQFNGRIELSKGPDLMGLAFPNNDSFGGFEGLFCDFGNYASLEVPSAAEVAENGGKIYGVLKFAAPTTALVNAAVEAIEAKYPEGTVKVTGLFISRDETATKRNQDTAANLGNTAAPVVSCISMSRPYLEKLADILADKVEGVNVEKIERYERTETSAAIGIIPADTDKPDLVISVNAHPDCEVHGPGASDNGSGVAGLIELARRFKDVDNGNIEIIFAATGAEESPSNWEGANYMVHRLIDEGKDKITINLTMDMISSPGPTSNGTPLNAVRAGIYERPGPVSITGSGQGTLKPLAFNLPAYLVTSQASNVTWADGIENVKILQGGGSDHEYYGYFGIEGTGVHVINDATAAYEASYHSAGDNLEENYSYEYHLMCVDMVAGAIQQAIDQKITKYAKLGVSTAERKITLTNAEQLFDTYETVEVSFGTEKVVFTGESESVLDIPAAVQDFEITDVTAFGTGTADYKNEARNEQYKVFSTKLVADITWAVAGFSLKAPAALGIGKTMTLEPVITPENAANKTIIWTSSNDKVATVDGKGVVKAVGMGSVVITGTTVDGGFTQKAAIKVM